MNAVDSSGWVEYFQDSRRADLFALAIEQRDQMLVPVIAMASSLHGLAMANAEMHSMALEFKATYWTQDVDYQALAGVKFFAKG